MKTQSQVALVAGIGLVIWSGVILINSIGDKIVWKIIASGTGFLLFSALLILFVLNQLRSKKRKSEESQAADH